MDPLKVALAGTQLVEASAGTGKTYTITSLVLRLLLDGLDGAAAPLELKEILVVTFTRAATAELKDRVRRRLREALTAYEDDDAGGDDTLRAFLARSKARPGGMERDRRLVARALQSFDEAQIFTIHSFCQRVLQDNAFESGASFDAELMTNDDALLREIVDDFWARRVQSSPLPVVEHMLRLGLEPARLVKLVDFVVGQPNVEVLPQSSDVDLAAAMTEWRSVRDAAAALFDRDRDAVTALLKSDALNRNSYKLDRIDDWIDRMGRELRRPCPGLVHWDKLLNFCPDKLTTATKKGAKTPTHPFFDACGRLLVAEQAVLALIEGAVVKLQKDLVQFARAEAAKRKATTSTQSFDDLLHALHGAVSKDGGAELVGKIRDRYRAALIDEFQDTDPVQYEIFRRVYEDTAVMPGKGAGHALFLIGDPKQAIYAFRGADIAGYLKAVRTAGAESMHTLATNRRSDHGLVHAVNALFGGASRPFLSDEIAFHPVQPHAGGDALTVSGAPAAPFEVLFLPRGDEKWLRHDFDSSNVARWTASEIARFLAAKPTLRGDDGVVRDVGPGDIAVLCRTNKQAMAVQRMLRKLTVPNVLQGDANVFDTVEADELERVLRALADPASPGVLRAALTTSMLGSDASEIVDMERDDDAWDRRVAKLQTWHEAWVAQGFIAAFRRMLDEEGLEARLLRRVDGERRITNLLHLGELLQARAVEGHLGPVGLVEWLRTMRTDDAKRKEYAAESAQMRLESDAHAVKMLTIHKSKGLEYPIVYCPFLWLSSDPFKNDELWPRFHDPATGELKIDVGAPESPLHDASKALAGVEHRAELLRLAYVALTRAKHRCTILWGAFLGYQTSPLTYLLHQPPDPAFALRAPASGSERSERLRGADDLFDATVERAKAAKDDVLRQDLQRFVDRAPPGAVVVRDLSLLRGPAWTPPAGDVVLLRRDTSTRKLDALFRLASYSSLAKQDDGARAPDVDRVHDRDEAAAGTDDVDDTDSAVVAAVPTAVPLAALPAGTRTGNLVHWIFEQADFTQPPSSSNATALGEHVADGLRRFQLPSSWQSPLTSALDGVLRTPMVRAGGFRLADVSNAARMNEMGFVFPVAPPSSRATPLHSGDVSAVLDEHAGAFLPPGYAASVRKLGFAPLAGFLQGAMDLAMRHDGRWYVVDYKSSKLGVDVDDYGPGRLVQDMAEHHYYLQALIYTVALHRFLSFRLRDAYRYDDHFGGILYLYIRGMAPTHPKDTGVFFGRPSRALVEALDALFRRGARAGAA